ncbi:O-antigen ligase [Bradyrhizobium liaoningense]|uniref:O-antigen ligase family protein n=1 Tax=Bradyrhizobium liaoningense TaxID=43992 RepID=UPI001BA964A9|nr:O-antigen ligase family protein [Bradyrhizobium liaoningense]MBR0714774.1 O-antigen ligase family protein [Bradyrhizobium liaoningense]
MIESLSKPPGKSWLSVIASARHDPAARIFNVDLCAALVAILLPWSTTGTTIAIGMFVVALLFTDLRALPQSLSRPISLLPVALFVLALIGTLWSEAAWPARLHGVGPAAKLLLLPLLFYHFERSPRGVWIFVAFLASCTLLMVVSFAVALEPSLSLKLYLSRGPYKVESGIAVRNYIDQSQEFALCAIALALPIAALFRAGRIRLAALLALLTLGFLANMTFVVVSRTTLVTLPILLAVFALLHLRWRTALLAVAAMAALVAVAWNVSPSLRNTVGKFTGDYELSMVQNEVSGMGARLEFWRKSLRFIADAPLIGHGTGSTRGLFERAAAGESGLRAQIVGDPHNQPLNVAVQWGALGVVILYAMWLAHLLMFRGEGLANWVGLLVVVQNVLSSLFNSHLFDFSEGWLYVLGVGVAGGMTLARRPQRQGAAS